MPASIAQPIGFVARNIAAVPSADPTPLPRSRTRRRCRRRHRPCPVHRGRFELRAGNRQARPAAPPPNKPLLESNAAEESRWRRRPGAGHEPGESAAAALAGQRADQHRTDARRDARDVVEQRLQEPADDALSIDAKMSSMSFFIVVQIVSNAVPKLTVKLPTSVSEKCCCQPSSGPPASSSRPGTSDRAHR
jgi:hypothetical protein